MRARLLQREVLGRASARLPPDGITTRMRRDLWSASWKTGALEARIADPLSQLFPLVSSQNFGALTACAEPVSPKLRISLL
jgi:hypothetical protein